MIDRSTFLKRAGSLFVMALIGRARIRLPAASDLHHPDPRAGITSEHVLSATDIGDLGTKKVLGAYDAARERPEIFDGLACACGCTDKPEHRSLLVCYETKQPTGCTSCREEAMLVAELAHAGKTLAEIRLAVDKKYG